MSEDGSMLTERVDIVSMNPFFVESYWRRLGKGWCETRYCGAEWKDQPVEGIVLVLEGDSNKANTWHNKLHYMNIPHRCMMISREQKDVDRKFIQEMWEWDRRTTSTGFLVHLVLSAEKIDQVIEGEVKINMGAVNVDHRLAKLLESLTNEFFSSTKKTN